MGTSFKGTLIAIEGIDGSGKTTQARLLKGNLTRKGFSSKIVKEPTKGKYGREIKSILQQEGEIDQEALFNLFVKDRRENVKEKILPALKRGKVVISDRYFISTLAYQRGKEISFERILNAHKFAPLPDLIFILDVSPEVAIRRLSGSKDKFEGDRKFLSKARENYHKIPELLSCETILLDGEKPPEQVQKRIWTETKRVICKNEEELKENN